MERKEEIVEGHKIVTIHIDGYVQEFTCCDDALELIDAYELNICPYCQGIFDEKNNVFLHGMAMCH